jgi:hypothetical protein
VIVEVRFRTVLGSDILLKMLSVLHSLSCNVCFTENQLIGLKEKQKPQELGSKSRLIITAIVLLAKTEGDAAFSAPFFIENATLSVVDWRVPGITQLRCIFG